MRQAQFTVSLSDDRATMEAEVAAWVAARNASGAAIDWQFTTADAWIKLTRLYPAYNA